MAIDISRATKNRALLPAGLHDSLAPDAAREATAIETLMTAIAAHGYDRVKPPMIEFEDSLLHGPGEKLAAQTFRLMDPESRNMMGVRADITPQIARIAGTRLSAAPRPLRLAYSGQVLRVKGSDLRPDRQFSQAGAELVGVSSIAARAEILLLAVEALEAVEVQHVSVDITIPGLVAQLADDHGLDDTASDIVDLALDRKDIGGLDGLEGAARDVFAGLMRATGDVARCRAELAAIAMTGKAAAIRDDLFALLDEIAARRPDLPVTIDPGEYRGFEYKADFGFTLFARNIRGELGKGGLYWLDDREPAVGVTFYMDTVLRALPALVTPSRVYVPLAAGPEAAAALRKAGWQTISGLDTVTDAEQEAQRLGCDHVWTANGPKGL